MNHLAHLYIGQAKIEWLVGNFIADQVKGKQLLQFSPLVQEGIKMHRAIDSFTDQHPIVSKSKAKLYPVYHKYSAVIVDVFYDHILAKNWDQYSPIPLQLFAQSSYALLQTQRSTLPQRSQKILFYMVEQDWLSNYAQLSGIEKTLINLSKRAKFDSKMEFASRELKKDLLFFQEHFMIFFPELLEFIKLKYA